MTTELIKDVDDKIQMLHESGIQFQMQSVVLLEMMVTAEDSEELKGETQWYAQIVEKIVLGDMSSITNDEKMIFLQMNDALIGIYEKQNSK